MKFLIGSQNFGLDTPESDKDYVEFIYPSVSHLCKPIPSAKEVKQEDGSIIKQIDVRSIPSLFYKSNLDTLQLLFSKEVHNGREIKCLLEEYEEKLSTINLPRFYQSIMGSAINRFKRETNKDLAHIIFGFRTLIQFEEQGFIELRECFEHNQNDVYLSIREGSYRDWFEVAKELEAISLTKKESYMSMKPNESFKNELEQIIGELVVVDLKKCL